MSTSPIPKGTHLADCELKEETLPPQVISVCHQMAPQVPGQGSDHTDSGSGGRASPIASHPSFPGLLRNIYCLYKNR
ncbi:hypothetical protein EGR_05877 [Echinococcus granulosus]|uniref:Uncharacterized protein n=1 Tax=Echinococcus granulosus TaxID=6210 RepID=W6UEE2_ECHGR|nr:hypothetical protein EGR_05877 [Echinococcus granulosus]EUB59276.1 hypothetical protein EGR_05877 [Echinococcus granulosus]